MSYFQSIYADENLPHRCKTVYIYLKDRSDASGSCWLGVKTIASDLGLSCSTVKQAGPEGVRTYRLDTNTVQISGKWQQYVQFVYHPTVVAIAHGTEKQK